MGKPRALCFCVDACDMDQVSQLFWGRGPGEVDELIPRGRAGMRNRRDDFTTTRGFKDLGGIGSVIGKGCGSSDGVRVESEWWLPRVTQ